jgi:hypothetical protein
MAAKALSYKNWCEENITPQAWPRILLKCIDTIRAEGMTIKVLEHPTEDIQLNSSLINAFNSAMNDLYELKIEEKALA